MAVNNWSLPTWVEGWDKVIGATRGIFQDFSLSGRRSSAGRSSHARSSNQNAISYVLLSNQERDHGLGMNNLSYGCLTQVFSEGETIVYQVK